MSTFCVTPRLMLNDYSNWLATAARSMKLERLNRNRGPARCALGPGVIVGKITFAGCRTDSWFGAAANDIARLED